MSDSIRTYDDFLNLLPERPRSKAGDGWLVICPSHNDHTPSLWITPADNPDFIADFKRLQLTGNPRATQSQLRHKSALMTMRYLKTLSADESLRIQQIIDFRW